MSEHPFLIRPYEPRDRSMVRAIAVATAMMGEPASMFLDGDDVLADLLTRSYTDFDSGASFVAEKNGEVVGYLISALDTREAERKSSFRVMGPAFFKALGTGFFFKRKNLLLFWDIVPFALFGGFVMPDFKQDYPATLHINVLNPHRRSGVGPALMQRHLEFLRQNKVKGVHLATMSEKAGHFFKKAGFDLLYRGSRPYFRRAIGKDVPLLVYGRKMGEK